MVRVQLDALTPTISDLVSGCLHHIRTSRCFDGYLIILKQFCKVISLKSHQGHRNLIDHLVNSQKVVTMLYLLLDILEGPSCGGLLKERVVELCLMQPYHLQDMIKLAGLGKLMKPLLLAFQSESDSLRGLALVTLESWADSLNPSFLEPKLKVRIQLLVVR